LLEQIAHSAAHFVFMNYDNVTKIEMSFPSLIFLGNELMPNEKKDLITTI